MDIQQPNSVKVNLDDMKDIVCEKCENRYFVPAFIIKKISSLVSPSGKEGLMPIQTFQCKECNHINEEFQHNGTKQ